jgi:hypothetical protein
VAPPLAGNIQDWNPAELRAVFLKYDSELV